MEGLPSGEFRGVAELFFDAQKLIVFGDAIGAGSGAGFDLTGASGNGEVGDEGVFGFAGSMGDDVGVVGGGGHLHGFERFGERTDLIDLDENGIGDAFFDAFGEARGVGYEQIV